METRFRLSLAVLLLAFWQFQARCETLDRIPTANSENHSRHVRQVPETTTQENTIPDGEIPDEETPVGGDSMRPPGPGGPHGHGHGHGHGFGDHDHNGHPHHAGCYGYGYGYRRPAATAAPADDGGGDMAAADDGTATDARRRRRRYRRRRIQGGEDEDMFSMQVAGPNGRKDVPSGVQRPPQPAKKPMPVIGSPPRPEAPKGPQAKKPDDDDDDSDSSSEESKETTTPVSENKIRSKRDTSATSSASSSSKSATSNGGSVEMSYSMTSLSSNGGPPTTSSRWSYTGPDGHRAGSSGNTEQDNVPMTTPTHRFAAHARATPRPPARRRGQSGMRRQRSEVEHMLTNTISTMPWLSAKRVRLPSTAKVNQKFYRPYSDPEDHDVHFTYPMARDHNLLMLSRVRRNDMGAAMGGIEIGKAGVQTGMMGIQGAVEVGKLIVQAVRDIAPSVIARIPTPGLVGSTDDIAATTEGVVTTVEETTQNGAVAMAGRRRRSVLQTFNSIREAAADRVDQSLSKLPAYGNIKEQVAKGILAGAHRLSEASARRKREVEPKKGREALLSRMERINQDKRRKTSTKAPASSTDTNSEDSFDSDSEDDDETEGPPTKTDIAGEIGERRKRASDSGEVPAIGFTGTLPEMDVELLTSTVQMQPEPAIREVESATSFEGISGKVISMASDFAEETRTADVSPNKV